MKQETIHDFTKRTAQVIHHTANVVVDVAAIAALYGIATTGGISESLAQVLGTAVVSVALGKRYVESRGGASSPVTESP